MDQVREYDSQLISVLGVGLICDLMVEMRKAVYGMTYVYKVLETNMWRFCTIFLC